MKTLIFSKAWIKETLSLTSKKRSLLLGTFFPLFMAYIYVVSCSEEDFKTSKSKTQKIISWVFFSLLFFGIALPIDIICFFMPFIAFSKPEGQMTLFPIFCLIVFPVRLFLSWMYWGLSEEERPRPDNIFSFLRTNQPQT
ncbi:MAG: hypothetical protein KC516_04370 [Nanoarchaeota archaeon]|nr:hypothetical protein [Nanoarchaeota archaeon]